MNYIQTEEQQKKTPLNDLIPKSYYDISEIFYF